LIRGVGKMVIGEIWHCLLLGPLSQITLALKDSFL